MKIKVKDLEANPYRKINKYPIDREKIKALKTSIKETTFWDNVLARKSPNNGKFQIAYGHHRLAAIKELGIKEVDIPVRDLDNGIMIQIMANENLDAWGMSPSVINETVLAAKEYLDGEFKKYEKYNKLPLVLIDLLEQKNEKSFNKAKSGVGQTTLLKFLGGNWKQWMVQEALSTLKLHKEKKVDRKAVEVFPKVKNAQVFKDAVKKHNIPIKDQKDIAKRLVKDEVSKREIPFAVAEMVTPKKKKQKEPKRIPWLEEKVSALIVYMADVDRETNQIIKNIGNVRSDRMIDSLEKQAVKLQKTMTNLLQELKNV